MVKKLVALILLVIIVVTICLVNTLTISPTEEDKTPKDKQYQGPVPEGYDLEHFRKTGETKRITDGR